MDEQPAEEKVTFTKENKSSLGKRKNSKPLEDNSNDGSNLDSVVMSEPRKKIQKLTHSNSVEKQPSFAKILLLRDSAKSRIFNVKSAFSCNLDFQKSAFGEIFVLIG